MTELAQFHSIFFDECEELLGRADVLLPQCLPRATSQTLTELRRYAHSIKGGAATFGFVSLAGLAAELEKVLAQALESGRQPAPDVLQPCADAFALLRELVDGLRCGVPLDEARAAQLSDTLARIDLSDARHANENECAVGEHDGCYALSFVLSRTLVGEALLVDDMLEQIGRVGRVVSTHCPAPGDRDARWSLQVVTPPERVAAASELRDIVAHLADPESLQIRALSRHEGNEQAVAAGSDAPNLPDEPDVPATASAFDGPVPSESHQPPRPPASVVCLVFAVGSQHYAVQADEVVEVRACVHLQQLPTATPALPGVIEVRGDYVPVIDARACLGLAAVSATPLRPVLLLCVDAERVGVVVDEVGDIVALTTSTIQAPQRVLASRSLVKIVGLARHEGMLLTIIELAALVRSAEWSPCDVRAAV